MKIYISGKITQNPDFEKQFNAAVSTLVAQGYEVIDPRNVCANIKNGSWEDYMILNLIELSHCEAILYDQKLALISWCSHRTFVGRKNKKNNTLRIEKKCLLNNIYGQGGANKIKSLNQNQRGE